MTYSDFIPYIPAVIGVLLLIMYAFMRREVYKTLATPANPEKTTLKHRALAYTLLSGVEADYQTAATRYYITLAVACLAYAATIGAWLPEATGWSGLFATWWWLLVSLCLTIVALLLKQRLLKLEAHGIEKLRDARKKQALADAHLYGDGRWFAQLQATTKYLIAALVCLMIAAGCGLFFW